MPTMIIGHERSKSNLMSDCFEVNFSEIFNLSIIDKNTFQRRKGTSKSSELNSTLWSQAWSTEYLKHVENELTKNPYSIFKVFLDHIIHSQDAIKLIKKINPRVFSIHRQNELDAIKSFLLAKRRGFIQSEQRHFKAFIVTKDEFHLAFKTCILDFNTLRSIFPPDWSTTYEKFDPLMFYYGELIPCIQHQRSNEYFNHIINQNEIDSWFAEISKNSKALPQYLH